MRCWVSVVEAGIEARGSAIDTRNNISGSSFELPASSFDTSFDTDKRDSFSGPKFIMKILHIGPVKNAVASDDADMLYEVCSGVGVDGPSRSIIGLAQALADEGVDVAVLPTKPFDAARAPRRGINYLPSYTGRKYNPWVNAEKWLDCVVERFGVPDLVNFHDVYDLFSCSLAREMCRRSWKYIVTPRGGLRIIAQQRDVFKKKIANALFFRKYLRGATLIHALTDNEARDISFFDPRLNSVVVPNALPRNFMNIAERIGSAGREDKREIVVGFIGQLFTEIKGVDRLLEAIALFQQSSPAESMRFVFVGPSRRVDDRRKIEKLMQRIPHPEYVEFVGPKYGKEKWLSLEGFDVFVLPSRTEGMPVVALEAMAYAKPCLFSAGTNMDMVIEEARGGWGCSGTPRSLCERLRKIALSSKEDLRIYGRNAQRCFERHYTWDVVVKKYLNMVRDLQCGGGIH